MGSSTERHREREGGRMSQLPSHRRGVAPLGTIRVILNGGNTVSRFFRHKPIVVEVVLWDGGNVEEVNAFFDDGLDEEFLPDAPFVIETSDGDVVANVGDWIIRGEDGEFHPCKPDTFEATYEVAEQGTATG